MSKRNNITYIKPADPKFLQQLKAQIGYRNSEPDVDTKRQKLNVDSDSDRSDFEDEAPQVVVLRKGDLTAEEAEKEQKRLEKEVDEKPADLSQRILFKSKKLEKPTLSASATASVNESTKSLNSKKDTKRPSQSEISKSKLSFQIEDDEDDEDDEDEE